MTIQQRIFYVILLVFTCVFALATSLYYWHFEQTLKSAEAAQASQINNYIKQELLQLLESHETFLESLDEDGDVKAAYDHEPWLALIGKKLVEKNFQSIFERYPYLQEAMFYQKEKLYVHIKSPKIQNALSAFIQQERSLGFVDAKVVIKTNPILLIQQHLRTNNIDPQTRIYFTNQDASWIISQKEVKKQRIAFQTDQTQKVEALDQQYLSSDYLQEDSWGIRSFISQSMTKEALNQVLVRAVIAYVLALIGIFFIARYLSSLTVRPLKSLEEASKRIIEGDFQKVELGQNDETRSTILAFNAMAEKIQGFTQELQEEVHKRTLELESLNKNLELRVEEEITRRSKQEELLIQQSKNAAMGEMIGVIAHQWKQPITVIRLLMQIIRDALNDPVVDMEDISQQTKKVDDQLEHMSNTITDFRNFLKPSNKLIHFDSIKVAQDVFKLNEAKFKDLAITFTIHEENSFELYGLPNDLRQVIMNIYSNACDVFQERNVIERNIDVVFESNAQSGVIRIHDNGGGIPDALLPDKLFERYVSTKGDNGTGLGLQICRTIIEERFNGKLWAHNVKDGAEFVIELPLTDMKS